MKKFRIVPKKLKKQLIELTEFWVSESVTWLPCLLLCLKFRSARGPSHHPAFMGNCLTISYPLSPPTTHGMSSPSTKWSRGDSLRYNLILSCLVWVKRIRGRESLIFSCLTPVVGALCLWLKYRSASILEYLTIQLLWITAQLLVTRF